MEIRWAVIILTTIELKIREALRGQFLWRRCIIKVNNNYDYQVWYKIFTDAETDRISLLQTFTSRTLGLEDAYLATASILYNSV